MVNLNNTNMYCNGKLYMLEEVHYLLLINVCPLFYYTLTIPICFIEKGSNQFLNNSVL